MITKELLKEYMVDWLKNYPDVIYKDRYDLAEYLADKIWDKIKPSKAKVNSVLSKEKQDLFDSVYPPSDWFDHAP